MSDPYKASHSWTLARIHDAGLQAHIDGASNIVGRLSGTNPNAPAIVTGAHTDTVHSGGRFDGIVGVLGAIEAARVLQESGTRLTDDLIVLDFLGEKANGFGVSCVGSRAVAGVLEAGHLSRQDTNGVSMGEAIENFGADPNQAESMAWNPRDIKSYIELHVEQGPMLECSGSQIGAVTSVAGIERVMAVFTGRADHTGTTPMDQRADALIASAEAILTVESVGRGAPSTAPSTSFRTPPPFERKSAALTQAGWAARGGASRRRSPSTPPSAAWTWPSTCSMTGNWCQRHKPCRTPWQPRP